MAAYITVGAKTTHGGTVITGSPHTTHNGIPVARVGDKVMCKKCKKVVTIATGDPSYIVDGAPIARGGDMTSCGSKLIAIQQAFAESDFEVMGIEDILQSPQGEDLKNNLTNQPLKKSNFKMGRISLGYSNEFSPLGIQSHDNKTINSEIEITANIIEGSYSQLMFFVNNQHILTKGGSFNAGDQVKIKWDGFINDKYDSEMFTKNTVTFSVKGHNSEGKTDEHSSEHRFKYAQCDWLDIKIDRKKNKIDANLRVSISPISQVTVLPKAVPAQVQKSFGQPLITGINISDSDVQALVKDSISRYWSRNATTLPGQSISITLAGSNYQVYTNCSITDKNSLPKLDIKFNTNRSLKRSRNWEMSRIVFYNVGYLLYPSGWRYLDKISAKEKFKKTFSHELGHEILLQYGGHDYSKTHKGSSTLITQEPNSAYNHVGNEYDLMKYATVGDPSFQSIINKTVASENDIKSFLYLSRIKIIPLHSRSGR